MTYFMIDPATAFTSGTLNDLDAAAWHLLDDCTKPSPCCTCGTELPPECDEPVASVAAKLTEATREAIGTLDGLIGAGILIERAAAEVYEVMEHTTMAEYSPYGATDTEPCNVLREVLSAHCAARYGVEFVVGYTRFGGSDPAGQHSVRQDGAPGSLLRSLKASQGVVWGPHGWQMAEQPDPPFTGAVLLESGSWTGEVR